MNNIKKVSFIGLGVMGFPMAGHLADKTDLDVTVYNRTGEKAEQWIGIYDGTRARTPAESAQNADVVFICVGNDDDLSAVLTGSDGVLNTVGEGTVIVDHTTVSADISRKMYEIFGEKGVSFIDAPVSGGQAGAENGKLTVMAGGDKDSFEAVLPIITKAYAQEFRLLGPSGAGQTAKMVNQICIAGLLQGLSEGLAFGQRAGLDMKEVLQVIGKGAAQSWQMDNRGETMLDNEFDFGFAIDWMIKDLSIALSEADRNGAQMDITPSILEFYKHLQQNGCGRMDTSALIKRLNSSL